MDYATLTDRELIHLMGLNNEHAFNAIYSRFWRNLYVQVVTKVRTEQDAEEIIQQIFLSLWERRSNLAIDNLGGYLAQAAKYSCIHYYTSKYLRQTWHTEQMPEQEGPQRADSKLLCEELMGVIAAAMDALPSKTREIFQMSRQERLSIAQIAARVNLSEKAVEYHITKALKSLRTILSEQGLMAYMALALMFLRDGWPMD